VEIVRFAGLHSLVDALRDVDDRAVVLAVPAGAHVVDLGAAAAVYDDLDGTVVLAAAATARVPQDVASRHPDVSTPYRFVAGDALAGPAGALRDLAARSDSGGTGDVAFLTERFLAGADLELDVGAALFVTLDGTGTDTIALGGEVHVPATGTRPPAVLGDAAAVESVRAAVAGDRSHDLVRLFGYDALDAAALEAPPEATVVAPEIVTVPFWTPAFCATVVRAAEACGVWAADPDDPVPGAEIPLATISPQLLEHVEAHVGELVVPALRAVWGRSSRGRACTTRSSSATSPAAATNCRCTTTSRRSARRSASTTATRVVRSSSRARSGTTAVSRRGRWSRGRRSSPTRTGRSRFAPG
jgi:hypothetical protein